MATQEQTGLIKQLVKSGIPLDQMPAGRPPKGKALHLGHTFSRANMISACDGVSISIVLIVVAMQVYTRPRLLKSLWWDDWRTLFALSCWLGETALFQYACRWGAGNHIWDISVALFAKLSILLLYRRVLPINNFAWQWWTVTAFTVASSIGGISASLFQCRPMRSAWSLDVAPEYCISTAEFYTANAALNVASDILIPLLPLPIVWDLNIDKRKKVILTGLFFMGKHELLELAITLSKNDMLAIISCLVSLLRMRSIIVLYKDGFTELTWGLVAVVIWTKAELTAGMICTCTPCPRPLLEKTIPALGKVRSRKGAHGSSTNGYLRTDVYAKTSTACKSKSNADIEMDAGIHKKAWSLRGEDAEETRRAPQAEQGCRPRLLTKNDQHRLLSPQLF